MAAAIIRADSAHRQTDRDFARLRAALLGALSKEDLRRWSLDTAMRRAALPRPLQARLRELTIRQQALVRGERNSADQPLDQVETVAQRLLDALSACAHMLTPDEARDFADCIRNTAVHLTRVVIDGEAA